MFGCEVTVTLIIIIIISPQIINLFYGQWIFDNHKVSQLFSQLLFNNFATNKLPYIEYFKSVLVISLCKYNWHLNLFYYIASFTMTSEIIKCDLRVQIISRVTVETPLLVWGFLIFFRLNLLRLSYVWRSPQLSFPAVASSINLRISSHSCLLFQSIVTPICG